MDPNNSVYNIQNNSPAYHNTVLALNDQIHKQLQVEVPRHSVPSGGPVRVMAVPNNLTLLHVNQPQRSDSDTSRQKGSSPNSPLPAHHNVHALYTNSTDSSEEPTFMQRPRQQMMSSPLVNPTSLPDISISGLSSPSSQASPSNSGSIPSVPDDCWSESYGQNSPRNPNSDLKSPTNPQIKNRSLHMETRYKQDKCYSCMKKVFPMEKLGPVRGVVYHKGCFRCKQCNTQLNMNNFFHSQNDSFDIAVYCKSHQPVSTDPRLDSESFEIKSALNAPRPVVVVAESERVPVHNYNYDVKSREIEHARRAPVANLQSGVKVRANAWSKSKRESYPVPLNVVRCDDPAPDEFNRFRIESQPDYE